MFSSKFSLSLALMASAALAAPAPPSSTFSGWGPQPTTYECGKTDVFFTGFPPNHPLVIAQGYPPNFVASALAEDKQIILKAGYNIKTLLQGPEQPISNDANGLYNTPSGVQYDAVIIGFGVRGAPYVNTTAQLEDEIALYRRALPNAPIGFNVSPNSTTEALKRVAPITGDCSKTPGKDYGTYIYCAKNVCTQSYSPQIGTIYS